MASASELLAILDRKDRIRKTNNPFVQAAEGALTGYQHEKNNQLANTLKFVQAEAARAELEKSRYDLERQKKNDEDTQNKLDEINGLGQKDPWDKEAKVQGKLAPVRKRQTVTYGSNGPTVVETIDDGLPVGRGGETVPAEAAAFIDSGDMVGLSNLYNGFIPVNVLRMAHQAKGQRAVQDRFDTGQESSKTGGLRDKFTTQSKDYISTVEAYQRVVASAQDPSPAGDLALIFNYMKTLDPGSTVREGEFANAAASGSYGDRLQVAAQRLMNGQRLSPEMRADFLDRARRLKESQDAIHSQRESEFSRVATESGLKPSKVIMKMDVPTPSGVSTPPPPAGDVKKGSDGKTYRKVNGKWFEE